MLHFASTRIRDEVGPRLQVGLVPVDKQFADWCSRERGVEPHRLGRWMTVLKPTNILHFEPFLFVHLKNTDSHLLIDGTHRYVACALLGIPEFPAIIVPEPEWKEYLIEMPPFSLKGWSGIR